jgi:hypothetical protein
MQNLFPKSNSKPTFGIPFALNYSKFFATMSGVPSNKCCVCPGESAVQYSKFATRQTARKCGAQSDWHSSLATLVLTLHLAWQITQKCKHRRFYFATSTICCSEVPKTINLYPSYFFIGIESPVLSTFSRVLTKKGSGPSSQSSALSFDNDHFDFCALLFAVI